MKTQELVTHTILKKESVGYLKSKFNLQQGILIMTDERIFLEIETPAGGSGIFGGLLKSRSEKANTVFNNKYWAILSVVQGKHGIQENILEITDLENTYRIVVKNYQEWAEAIKEKTHF